MTRMPPTVEVPSIPGCGSAANTLRMFREAAASLVPGAEVRWVRLTAAGELGIAWFSWREAFERARGDRTCSCQGECREA